MIHLRTLGGLDLVGSTGHPVRSVLTQPRRLALFAYLVLARPRTFHRRDKLLALFWPESDEEHARGALSQAIYRLRSSLGAAVLVNRGRDEISANPDLLWCDATAFEAMLDAGSLEAALELYRGDLLDGFFIDDAPEFEQWLERERSRLRERAREAFWALAGTREKEGRCADAVQLARRAAALAPADEAAVRRLVLLLERHGDRAAALDTYGQFAAHLRDEYGLEPSAALRDAIGAVRASEGASHPDGGPTPPPDDQPAHAAPTMPDAGPMPDGAAPPRPRTRLYRPWAPSVAALALILIALSGYAVLRPPAAAVGHAAADGAVNDHFRTPAVAVLPFVNISASTEDDYFSDGLTEEVLNTLSRIDGIDVAARTSSFAFRGAGRDVREIARALGVSHVLEGSVRNDGESIRIAVQLIDAGSGYELWSRTYHRRIEDVFTIQEEIGRAIAAALAPMLVRAHDAVDVAPPTHDVDAYSLYLRGRFHFNLRSVDDARRAVAFFNEAIARDSMFAQAHAGLADVYALLPYYRAATSEESFARAKAAAMRAIELNPALADPHVTLGWIAFTYNWDWTTAEREFEQALRLDPRNTDALHFYSLYLARVAGRHRDAIALAERAQRLDPLSPLIHTGAGAVFYHARQFERAKTAHRHALALDSSYSVARYMLAEALLASGDAGQAVSQLLQIGAGEAPSGDRSAALLAHAYVELGRRAEAETIMERAVRNNVSPVVLAIVQTKLGRIDAAFESLDRAVDEHDPAIVEIGNEPLLDPLRADPRFAHLAARLKLP